MSILPKKTVIIVAGPTAVGKTAFAITLAKHFHTEIISADSRQCFKELNIGVARPSEKELKQIKHHFIASNIIKEEITAATFEKFALQKVEELFIKHEVVIMVGGTGLYIKVFCEGLDEVPKVKPEIRDKIIEAYKLKGLVWLQQEVENKDAEFFRTGENKNPHRLMRALEVIESTGKSILEFRKGKKTERDFRIIKIGLELPKEELHFNINNRVNKMMEDGLVNEVKGLIGFKHLNALQTVGYKEIFEYLNNNITFTQATEEIKKNTRQYAKRQMTWFKKDQEMKWFSPLQSKEAIEFALILKQ